MNNQNLRLGYFGSTVRFVLLIINFLFFIIGLVLFITACILKWGTSFTEVIKIDGIDDLLHWSSISAVAIVLMIVSGFIMGLSCVGFLGVKYMKRSMMIIYEIVVGILLLTHGISVLVVVFGWSSLEKEFQKDFTKVIDEINANETTPKKFNESCTLSYDLSSLFKCCGAEGPDDFFNQTLVTSEICCKSKMYTKGCNYEVVSKLKGITRNLLITPSVILIITEVFAVIVTPFLIRIAGKRSQYQQWG